MPRDSFIQVTVSSSGKPREVNIWGISASVDAAVQLGRWEHQHQCIFFTCLSYFGSLCVHMKLTSLVEETWSPVNEKEVVENKVRDVINVLAREVAGVAQYFQEPVALILCMHNLKN